MTVVPFRKLSPAAVLPERALSIADRVNAAPGLLGSLDLSGAQRLEGPAGEDGSPQVVFSLKLELTLRQLVARFGLPRLPFTTKEVDALLAYIAYLESGRADGLPGKIAWQQGSLRLAKAHHPGYATGLRLFIAENLPGLREHHRSACGYAELITYADEYH